jgi:hypothetical protein
MNKETNDVREVQCPSVCGPKKTFTLFLVNGRPALWVCYEYYSGYYRVSDENNIHKGHFKTKQAALRLARKIVGK